MAVNEWLADALVESVRAAALIPASDEESTTAGILAQLNFEQRLYLSGLLQKAREDYLTESADISIISGTTRYRLPQRCAAGAIKRVCRFSGGQETPLHGIRQERIQALGGTGYGTGEYYFDGNYLVVINTPSASDTWRIYYQRRLNKVVESTAACVVAGFDGSTEEVELVLASDGSTTDLPTAFVNGATYDFIRGTPHFEVFDTQVATVVGANVITFAAGIPDTLEVGDMVAISGQTPICNVPVELQDVLVLKAAHSYMAARGDANKVALLEGRWKQAEADALTLMCPRVKDSPDLLINPNAPGWNRMRWRWRRTQ